MTASIEAIYIYDQQKRDCILEHVYRSRPPSPKTLLSHFQDHPAPRPALLYLPSLSPPTTVASVKYSNILLLCPSTTDQNALAILEFLHRVIDVFEDFLGAPLLAHKIETSYDIVAQLLEEVCDGGLISNTEPNALRENVEVEGLIGKFLNQVGLPSSSPGLGPTNNLAASLKANAQLNSGPALPWRRANVRHTSNELYVDIIERVSVLLAPSGRPISAMASGAIAFTANVSGVPELLLSLSAPGGSSGSSSNALNGKQSGIARLMQSPVFHPCVRLARWKEHPGDLSFVPPDGRFVLAGYEVDLMPSLSLHADQPPSRAEKLFMPATVDLRTGLGDKGADFEVRLTLNTNFPGTQKSSASTRSGTSTPTLSFGGSGSGGFASAGTSNTPVLETVVVHVPLPEDVRSVMELRTSRGEAYFQQPERTVEWKVPTKEDGAAGNNNRTIVLTGTIIGPPSAVVADEGENEDDRVHASDDPTNPNSSLLGYYDADVKSSSDNATKSDVHSHGQTGSNLNNKNTQSASTSRRRPNPSTASFMPHTATVSFKVRGWIPSGIKVDALVLDSRRSRGIGDNVKPFKGVKYVAVSRDGVERRA